MTHALSTTSTRLKAALEGLKGQAKAAASSLPGSNACDSARASRELREAQAVMANHLPEVKAILETVRTIESTVVDVTLQDVIAGGYVILDRSAA